MATIKDVARACQVCPATVSNVLNNRRAVHPATRDRVLKAARELKYHPSAIGRGLVHRRMNTLGIVFLHSDTNFHLNQYLVAILEGVLAVAAAKKQNTTLCTSYSWARGGDLLPTICDGRTDGAILIVPPLNDHLAAALLEAGLPFVLVGSKSDDPEVTTVDVDNVDGARRLVLHMLEQGHRRIALLHFKSELSFSFSSERIEGYHKGFEEFGVPCDESLIAGYTSFDEEPEAGYTSLYQELKSLMSRPVDQRPTALFCIHDRAAVAAIEDLRKLGFRVPEDVSVTGFDDMAGITNPPLTTIHQPFRQIGERAAELLLSQIDASVAKAPLPIATKEILPAELIVRGSVAPPA